MSTSLRDRRFARLRGCRSLPAGGEQGIGRPDLAEPGLPSSWSRTRQSDLGLRTATRRGSWSPSQMRTAPSSKLPGCVPGLTTPLGRQEGRTCCQAAPCARHTRWNGSGRCDDVIDRWMGAVAGLVPFTNHRAGLSACPIPLYSRGTSSCFEEALVRPPTDSDTRDWRLEHRLRPDLATTGPWGPMAVAAPSGPVVRQSGNTPRFRPGLPPNGGGRIVPGRFRERRRQRGRRVPAQDGARHWNRPCGLRLFQEWTPIPSPRKACWTPIERRVPRRAPGRAIGGQASSAWSFAHRDRVYGVQASFALPSAEITFGLSTSTRYQGSPALPTLSVSVNVFFPPEAKTNRVGPMA